MPQDDTSNSAKQTSFVESEKRKRGRPPVDRPIVNMPFIAAIDAELAVLQKPMISRLQKLLDELHGSKRQRPDENKHLVHVINDLVERYGLDLKWQDEKVSLAWDGKIFRVRRTIGEQLTLLSSAGFPKLIVCPRQPVEIIECAKTNEASR